MKNYKVINIVDEYTIIINAGYKDHLNKGDEIRIYTEGEEIFDLDGKNLGIIDIIKDELEIVEVFEKFSICKKIKVTEKNILQPINFIKKEEIICKLNVKKEEISNLKYSDKTPIAIGDLVKKIERY